MTFQELSHSSQIYFKFLLDLQLQPDWLQHPLSSSETEHSDLQSLIEGYVTAADAGSEELIRSARAALVEFCDESGGGGGGDSVVEAQMSNLQLLCGALVGVLKQAVAVAEERVVVAALEVIAFLFDAGVMQRSGLS